MIKQWSLLALAVCASISPVAFADSVTDLSLRVRDAIVSSNADQRDGDLNELRVIIDYPFTLL